MADGITNAHNSQEQKPPYGRPLLIQVRYRCDCVNREVLTESMVIDMDLPEGSFIWTMKRLREDILAEVAQHIKERGPYDTGKDDRGIP